MTPLSSWMRSVLLKDFENFSAAVYPPATRVVVTRVVVTRLVATREAATREAATRVALLVDFHDALPAFHDALAAAIPSCVASSTQAATLAFRKSVFSNEHILSISWDDLEVLVAHAGIHLIRNPTETLPEGAFHFFASLDESEFHT
ncbi:hypothetical protein ACHAWU_006978 [Discostella pseudostelligera]|uniref:Uncharacterized protein n=1 Tax=Discostella pseudostelligera TaxID=259834 RepID=A0ABD3MUI2_9STRA